MIYITKLDWELWQGCTCRGKHEDFYHELDEKLRKLQTHLPDEIQTGPAGAFGPILFVAKPRKNVTKRTCTHRRKK